MATRDQILDTTETLITEKGFSGFSFQDVADIVDIKKASIYYYFPAKGDLGKAVVARYREKMRAEFGSLPTAASGDFWPLLARYMAPMVDFGRTPKACCLSGVLGGEFHNLPEDVQREVTAFFEEHETFLTSLLERGRDVGEFAFAGEARNMARLLLSAVEGALLIKRIKGDTAYFQSIVALAKQMLSNH